MRVSHPLLCRGGHLPRLIYHSSTSRFFLPLLDVFRWLSDFNTGSPPSLAITRCHYQDGHRRPSPLPPISTHCLIIMDSRIKQLANHIKHGQNAGNSRCNALHNPTHAHQHEHRWDYDPVSGRSATILVLFAFAIAQSPHRRNIHPE